MCDVLCCCGAGLPRWYQGSWTLRAGLFDLSNVPNSVHLEPGFHELEAVAELEKRHGIQGRPGRLLLTVFDNRGRMGLLDDAVKLARHDGTPVDIAAVRRYRSCLGESLGLEQQLCSDVGMFARVGKAAGNVEAYEFTDIDRSFSMGVSLKGSRWSRPRDTLGVAGIFNGISGARERYLSSGGLGILVGDGRLPHPGQERIMETYYEVGIFEPARLTLDCRWVENPVQPGSRAGIDRGRAIACAILSLRGGQYIQLRWCWIYREP